jgi:hypothetical protein
MLKTLAATLVLTFAATASLACTPEDVEARQQPLLEAMQALMAVDAAKAQAIVAKMQEEMAAAAAANDDAAVCGILDRALEEATS